MDCSFAATFFWKKLLVRRGPQRLLFWNLGSHALDRPAFRFSALRCAPPKRQFLSGQTHAALVTAVCKWSLVAICDFFGIHCILEDCFGKKNKSCIIPLIIHSVNFDWAATVTLWGRWALKIERWIKQTWTRHSLMGWKACSSGR